MKDYLDQSNRQLDELIVQVRGELLANDRKKFNTVLIVDVHARDVIENFVRNGIAKSQDFEWESQLRYYWQKRSDEPGDLIVIQCSGTFAYGYDYMGLNGRLVITPLTDRIYLTITQALSMQLGCAPAGKRLCPGTEGQWRHQELGLVTFPPKYYFYFSSDLTFSDKKHSVTGS